MQCWCPTCPDKDETNEVDAPRFRKTHTVNTVGAGRQRIAGGGVAEEAFVADCHQVVRIDALHVFGSRGDPVNDRCVGATARRRIPLGSSGASAFRLVCQLPRHDGRVILVGHVERRALHRIHVIQDVARPVLVPLEDRGIGVEVVVVLRRNVSPSDVLIHPAKIGPVVGEGHNEFDPQLVGLGDHVIHVGKAVGGVVVCGRSGARVEVLQVITVSAASIARYPHADDPQVAVDGSSQNLVDRRRIRIHQRIGIGAAEAEGLAVPCKRSVGRLDESVALAGTQRGESSQAQRGPPKAPAPQPQDRTHDC